MSPAAVAEVEQIIEDIRQSTGPVTSARSLPREAYLSQEFFEFEREAVLGRSWLFLCHESQVSEPGDHLQVTVGNEPLVVTRDADGAVHVLSAVCQHRGFVLGHTDDEVGTTRNLRCPYHYWTYGMDGRLLSAPSMGPAHDLDHLKATVCLPRMQVEIWHGLVFANLDPEADALSPTVEAASEALAPYRLGEMVVAKSVTLADLPFNWKNMQENALEEYHTTYVHRGLHENVPPDLVRHGPFESGCGAVFRHAGMVIKGGEPVPGRPTFPVIEGLPEHERGHFLFLSVPPMLFAAVRPDGAKVFRIEPHAADRMSLTITFLFPPATLELENFDELLAKQVQLIDLLDQPDIESNTRMYAGLRSEFAPRGPFSPQESSLPQLNQWLLDRYTSAAGRSATAVSLDGSTR